MRKRLLIAALVVLGLIAAALVLHGPGYTYVSVTTDGKTTEAEATGWGATIEVQHGDTHVRSSAW